MKESLSFSSNPDKLKLFPAIESVIMTGKIGEDTPPNHARKDGIVSFKTITGEVTLEGKSITMEVLLGKDSKGNLYYDLFVDRNVNIATDSESTAELNIKIIKALF